MMKRACGWIALLTVAALPTLAAEKVERLAVVDRSLSHHGSDVVAEGEVRLEMCSKSGCSRLRSRMGDGLFDLEAAGKVGDGERRVRITNDSVEWWENGELREVDADRAQTLRDWVMARIYFTFLPFRLNDPSVFKQDLGLESWGGRELHKVKVTFTPGSSTHAQDEYMYWFDPESGRLEQFAYSYAANGGGLRFRKTFDHRQVGGVVFFDQENWGVEGPGLSVDLVTPSYVEAEMRLVSTIRLNRIQVGRP